MGTFKNIEEAKEHFKKDRFATTSGMVLDELGEDYSVASVILNDAHKNAYGGIMGGAIFTLADLAFAALSNNIHQPTVAQQVSINYLGAPKGEKMIARAYVKKDGKRTCTINVDVTDDTGRDVAQFIGSGFKL
ncbi:MAG TPA: phenylacetic acid degradation protein [Lachnospiraceae bacterium]|nr:phenylacetic acid degradation protein [Lachnospiraceae bacterium]